MAAEFLRLATMLHCSTHDLLSCFTTYHHRTARKLAVVTTGKRFGHRPSSTGRLPRPSCPPGETRSGSWTAPTSSVVTDRAIGLDTLYCSCSCGFINTRSLEKPKGRAAMAVS